MPPDLKPYGCAEYREEMMLLGLQRRLNAPELSQEERHCILREIEELKQKMDMD